MGRDDLAKKAGEALSSDKVEELSDQVLDAAAGAAKKATGGKFGDQIDAARDTVDGKIGTD
ncbi:MULTISPECIES: Rv0909 family putative TA system antitoxin [Actinomyces]|uniref:Antitoxin n=1 Tax=Actinomyces respiraculi TaxID=2744574 RepID=A0A7T0LKR1_9ACTO|nr:MULTISPECIES: Rv0909 family putative TA system antitoxin [Actinomyces]QPL05594.1 antitoxin [Actinomyces respiraculi]